MPKKTTYFGYQRVAIDDKARKVAQVFHSVADRYDLMNDLMSFGVHRLWKRFALSLASIKSGQRMLDLAGGTGDLAAELALQVGPEGEMVVCDINGSMLRRGRERLMDRGVAGNIYYVQADAEFLPFPDNHFDGITIAFGLRNFTHKEMALQSMFRVLRPGGRVLILEFSKPYGWVAPVYDLYSFKVLPLLGKLIVNDSASYRYLVESIRMHPDQETLQTMMEDAGFEHCEYFNLSAGIVALHRGYKL